MATGAGSGDRGWIVPLATAICEGSRFFSGSRILGVEAKPKGLHAYILAWFVILVVILFAVPTTGAVGLIAVAVAFYRLQDFLFASLDQALGLTGQRSFTGSAWQGPVLIALINLGQVVLFFAIAYQVLVTRSAFKPAPAGTPFGHLFLSWRSLPPLGSGYLPQTVGSRVLAILESGTGILMLTITLARFLRGPSSDKGTAALLQAPVSEELVSLAGLSTDRRRVRLCKAARSDRPVSCYRGNGAFRLVMAGLPAVRLRTDTT